MRHRGFPEAARWTIGVLYDEVAIQDELIRKEMQRNLTCMTSTLGAMSKQGIEALKQLRKQLSETVEVKTDNGEP